MNDSFWAGGPDAYKSGIRAHYDMLLRDLQSQLSKCSNESQRTECESKIAQTEAEYKAKLKEINKLLF